jgi:hypothetical protein
MKKKTGVRSMTVRNRLRTAGLQRARRQTVDSEASCIAKLVGVSSTGTALVLMAGQAQPVEARTTVDLSGQHVGRDVLVCQTSPPDSVVVVIGLLRGPGDADKAHSPDATAGLIDVQIDRQRIVLTAQRELVLRCGKSSIALGADGKVVIKGANLLSTAAGLHRIRGGAVQIN